MTDTATTVLLVDDHGIVRHGLRALLDANPTTTVIGEAATAHEAVQLARDLQPDIVVMDINLPDHDGIEATRQIVAQSPHIAVLVLTMFDDDETTFAALRAGARGYLLKGDNPHAVVPAVEAVGRGEAIFGPSVARQVLRAFDSRPSAPAPAVAFPDLTPRERDVLAHLARGARNTDIARALALQSKTVRNHVSNIITKLAVLDRTEAILKARATGLGG
jgi:DNA-binding NarL/FixJ family response regulator